MQVNLPAGRIHPQVVDLINTILAMNGLNPISRQDQIRGYVSIPESAAKDVYDSMKVNGLTAA